MLPAVDVHLSDTPSGLDPETGKRKAIVTWGAPDIRRLSQHNIEVAKWENFVMYIDWAHKPDKYTMKNKEQRNYVTGDTVIEREDPDLHTWIENNVFNIIHEYDGNIFFNRCGNKKERGTRGRIGYPDFMVAPFYASLDQCKVIVEIKTFWQLRCHDLVKEWNVWGKQTQEAIRNGESPEYRPEIQVIAQVVDYMINRKADYAIISTYKNWWFCRKETSGTKTVLWISDPVSYRAPVDIPELIYKFVCMVYEEKVEENFV